MSENSEELSAVLSSLTSLSSELLDLLQAERAAVIARDHVQLGEIVEAKSASCERIDAQMRQLGSQSIRDLINDASAEHSLELEHLHNSLLAIADKAQEYNAVNGKIVRRSQQSVRELIHMISGTDAERLYGQQGQTMATAQGTAIAKA